MKTNKNGRTMKTFGRLKNYLAWIANLGVVPLFLFCAFLFAPALFFFASLLFVVTLVLETILKLLSNQLTSDLFNIKVKYVPDLGLSVNFFILTLCFLIPLLCNAKYKEPEKELILTRGEVKIIPYPTIKKYAISNKEVIKYQFNPQKKEFIVKALKIGHSKLSLFKENGESDEIDILVINKNLDEKITALELLLKKFNLGSKQVGNHLEISGELNNAHDYFEIQKIIVSNSKLIINQLQLSKKIKNEILGLIYTQLLKDNIESIKCDFLESDLICSILDNEKINDTYKNFLEANFGINLVVHLPNLNKNYSVKIKMFQLEQLDGEEIRLGLEELNTNIQELITLPIKNIVEKNSILLKGQHLDLSTLAEPQIEANLRQEAIIQLGSDLAFKSQDQNKNSTTEWKFSGLKIKIILDQVLDKIKIKYETELSRPSEDGNSISGSKGISSITIPLNTPTKLFQITLKTEGKNEEALPFLSKIPILGELFKSKSKSDNFKTLTAIIEVQNHD